MNKGPSHFNVLILYATVSSGPNVFASDWYFKYASLNIWNVPAVQMCQNAS